MSGMYSLGSASRAVPKKHCCVPQIEEDVGLAPPRSSAAVGKALFNARKGKRKSGSLPDLSSIVLDANDKPISAKPGSVSKNSFQTPLLKGRVPLLQKTGNGNVQREYKYNTPLVQTLRQKLKEVEKSKAELKEDYQKTQEHCEELDDQNRKLTHDAIVKENNIAGLSKTIGRLREQLSASVDIAQFEITQDKLNEISALYKKLRTESDSLKKKTTNLSEELREADHREKAFAKALDDAKVNIEAKNTNISSLNSDLLKRNETINSLNMNIAIITQKYDELSKSYMSRENDLIAQLNTLNAKYDRDVTSINVELKNEREENRKNQSVYDQLCQLQNELEEENSDLKRKLQTMGTELKDSNESHTALRHEREALVQSTTNLSEELRESNLREKSMVQALDHAKVSIEVNLTNISSLNSDLLNRNETINSLNTKIGIITQKYDELSTSSMSRENDLIAQLDALNAKYGKDVNLLTAQLKNEREENRKNQSICDHLCQLQNELEEDNSDLKRELETMGTELKDVYELHAALSAEREVFVQSTTNLSEELRESCCREKSLEQALDDAKANIAMNDTNISSLNSDLLKQSKTINDLKTKIDVINQKYDELSTISMSRENDLIAQLATLNAKYDRDVTSINAELKNEREEAKKNHSAYDQLCQLQNEIEEENSDLKRKLETIGMELKDVNVLLAALSDEREALVQSTTNLSEELRESNLREKSMEQALGDAKVNIETKNTDISSLNSDLLKQSETINGLNTKIDVITQKYDELSSSSMSRENVLMEQFNTLNSKYDEDVNLLTAQLKNEREDNEALRANISSLNSDLHKQNETINNLNTKIGVITQKYDELLTSSMSRENDFIEQLNTLNTKYDEDVNLLSVQLKTEREDNEAMRTNISSLNSDLLEGTEIIDNLNTKIDVITQKYDELSSSSMSRENVLVEQFNTLNSKYDEDVNSLSVQLKTEREDNEAMRTNISSLNSDLLEGAEIIDNLNMKIADLTQQYDELSMSYKSRENGLIVELNTTKSELARCIEKCEHIKSRSAAMSKSYEDASHHLTARGTELVEQLQAVRAELRRTEDSFRVERQQKDHFMQENKELSMQIRDLQNNSYRGGNTYVCPTINMTQGAEQSAATFLTSLSSSLANVHNIDHHPANISISQPQAANRTFRVPQGIGRSFTVADEAGEFMNLSNISAQSRSEVDSSLIQPTEDPLVRLNMLQKRNHAQPPHLRSSYAAEYQELPVSEAAMKCTNTKKVLVEVGNRPSYTVTETTTHEVKTSKTYADGYVKGPQGRVTPSKRSIFRRMKKWSPTETSPSVLP